MKRPIGYLSFLLAALAGLLGGVVQATTPFGAIEFVPGLTLDGAVAKALLAASVLLALNGLYLLTTRAISRWSRDKRRVHDVRNVLRVVFGGVSIVAVLGVITEQWVGVLFSLGIVGFAITFALQQPMLSALGWVYILLKRPFQAGDRVRIEDTKGDVIEIDFLVTTLWEIDGELVASNQPSGRVVTVPNSVVLSSQVINFEGRFAPIWNEVSVQLAYETDLDFAARVMAEEADDYLGDRMAGWIQDYRELLAETPVEQRVQVDERPTVNVAQEETWLVLRVRYLTEPRRAQRRKNELYSRIMARFNEHPERVKFPVGRNR